MSVGTPIARRAPATTSAAASEARASAGASTSDAINAAPAADPVRTTKPASSSVNATSKPDVASGPVPMDVQKHVDAGVAHSTATTNADARRAW